jgi:hypothetical protein
MTVKMRQEVERKVVGQLVRDILKAGYRLAVSLERGYDVDEMLIGSTDYKAIMDAAFAGDEAHIFIQPTDGPTLENGQVISDGRVYLVFGNDGYDVISDYTVNLEPLMAGANNVSDRYA